MRACGTGPDSQSLLVFRQMTRAISSSGCRKDAPTAASGKDPFGANDDDHVPNRAATDAEPSAGFGLTGILDRE